MKRCRDREVGKWRDEKGDNERMKRWGDGEMKK